ncbi:MAG: CHAP domain-containing protein [Candidatus Dormibacteria bacterium]
MWVLLAALALPLFVPHTSLSPQALPLAGQIDDSVGLSAAIERPPFSPTLISRPAQTIVTTADTTIDALAAANHTDAAAIRWANRIPDGHEPSPGTDLLLPPGPGALVRVLPSERPSQFANRLGIEPRLVLDYNSLTKDTPRPAGSWLLVPLPLAPGDALAAADVVLSAAGAPAVRLTSPGGNNFPYGQCTWYVATRRRVSWSGNAVAWWSAARGIRPEGHTPIQGAIVVFSGGWFGHVGYVEKVNPNGTFEMSEMNYFGATGGGWGRVDRRTISPRDSGISGFIY